MITIHGLHTPQNGFNNCGLAVLKPVSAYITEELNGMYQYELDLPCIHDDPYGNNDSWKHVKVYNIIKSNTGQLFQINKVQYYTKGGVPYVKAYAPHIWYYLADMLVYHAQDTRSLYWAMEDLFTERTRLPDPEVGTTWFSHGTGLTDYTFDYKHYYIPPGENDMRAYKFDYVSLGNAILGNSDSVCNLWNVELHRDNFYFSLMRRKEGTSDGAFYLKYGLNCTDVKYTDDISTRKTEVRFYDNGGNARNISYIPDAGTFPHQAIAGAYMTYNDPAYKDLSGNIPLDRDLDEYWDAVKDPKYTWDVAYVDFHLTNKENGYERPLKVGDAGILEDALGHRTQNQRIISMKTNDLTGRVENIKLGQFLSSGAHQNRWDKKVEPTNDTPEGKRMTYLESNINSAESDIGQVRDDVNHINSDIGNINNSITDINAAIQDIYSKLPQNP